MLRQEPTAESRSTVWSPLSVEVLLPLAEEPPGLPSTGRASGVSAGKWESVGRVSSGARVSRDDRGLPSGPSFGLRALPSRRAFIPGALVSPCRVLPLHCTARISAQRTQGSHVPSES